MSESFYSSRLTNHAIEAMAKRSITLPEVKVLIESGELKSSEGMHSWIYFDFPERSDNLVCAAIVKDDAIIVKTIMIKWEMR